MSPRLTTVMMALFARPGGGQGVWGGVGGVVPVQSFRGRSASPHSPVSSFDFLAPRGRLSNHRCAGTSRVGLQNASQIIIILYVINYKTDGCLLIDRWRHSSPTTPPRWLPTTATPTTGWWASATRRQVRHLSGPTASWCRTPSTGLACLPRMSTCCTPPWATNVRTHTTHRIRPVTPLGGQAPSGPPLQAYRPYGS